MRKLKVGLLGCGVVGAGFIHLLNADRQRLASRFGLEIEVTRILVRDLDRLRPGIDPALLTRSALDVLDGDCDVVVELIGGTASAGAFLRRAIQCGRHVVTANKALLAERGAELFRAASARGVSIGYEASVCGGVPIVRALQCSAAGDTIERITGILNGTCNFILSRMEEGSSFGQALAVAQASGFAEADPGLDVDGVDAAQKLQVLAALAFEAPLRRSSVQGISALVKGDFAAAAGRGHVIRLIAEAKRVTGGIELIVEPRALPRDHPLARITNENNGVQIIGRATGELFLSGKGAGSMPTAAAVLADVVDMVRRSTAIDVDVHRTGASGVYHSVFAPDFALVHCARSKAPSR